ncbi:MAG: rhodanese-like domain-containing protein [Fluviicola sp.]
MEKNVVIIDVREPKEFKDGSISGAINIPSTHLNIDLFQPYKSKTICLYCQSGNRAKQVQKRLSALEFTTVLLDYNMEDLIDKQKDSGWTVDRQFRMLLGILIAISMIGYFSGVTSLLIISIIVATGLIFTALIDRCYLRMLVASMPWNKSK